MDLNLSKDSDFSLNNIPFGIFSTRDRSPRVASAIGDFVIDLKMAADLGFSTALIRKSFPAIL
jgi:fumarylacetoacetase